MSYETNLHRTFEHQLSPVALRIIEWVPVKSVTSSVLQTGRSSKSFTVVDDATPNASAAVATYLQQEKRQRVHDHYGCAPSPAVAHTSGIEPPVSGVDALAPAAAATAPPLTGPSAGSAHPTFGPLRGIAGGGDHDDLTMTPLEDRQWLPRSVEVSSVTSAVITEGGVPPAASLSTLKSSAVLPVGGGSIAGWTPTALSGSLGDGTLRSGAVASPSASAALVEAPSRSLVSPPSFSSPLPTILQSRLRYGVAGTVYGFDEVYRNNSFGVLVAFMTAMGYHQTRICYHCEEKELQSQSSVEAASPNVLNGGTVVAVSPPLPRTAGAPLTSCSASPASPTANRNSPDAPAVGAAPTAAACPSAPEAATGEGSNWISSSWWPRKGHAIAFQQCRQLQLCNTLQLFWYWGVRRWTGVFNLRVLPLGSGDSWVPVCEYVVRTPMTESSILMADPVLYLHGFVVMLGRRVRTPNDPCEEGNGWGAPTPADAASDHAGELGRKDNADVQRLRDISAAAPSVSSVARKAEERPFLQPPHVSSSHHRSSGGSSGDSGRVNISSAELTAMPSSTEAARRSGGERAYDRSADGARETKRSNVLLPADAPHQAVATGGTVVSSTSAGASSLTGAHRRGGKHAASPASMPQRGGVRDAAHTNREEAGSATDVAGSVQEGQRPWLAWYERCVRHTTEEWLWNRTASEVFADAAASHTPWWKPRHVKMGAGLSFRYRKPRGVNVYWGWSAQIGRGTHLAWHIDVLRRMSCAVSSTFGFVDVSVRLRVNLVTLHQTALDAGVCWRPLPQVPGLALRLATSANGGTLGVELANVAPTLYGPIIDRLAQRRERCRGTAAALQDAPNDANTKDGEVAAVPLPGEHFLTVLDATTVHVATMDNGREDLVGLLPITWHYLKHAGSTVSTTCSSAGRTVASLLAASTTLVGSAATDASLSRQSLDGFCSPVTLPPPPPFAPPATSAALSVEQRLSHLARPLRQVSLRYAQKAWKDLVDLHWLEDMLRTSHLNVSIGISSERRSGNREWSCFLMINEK